MSTAADISPSDTFLRSPAARIPSLSPYSSSEGRCCSNPSIWRRVNSQQCRVGGKVFYCSKVALPCKMTLAPNAVMVRMMEQSSKWYLYYFLISSQGYKELDAISTGVAVKKFNKTELRTILIPLPPLAEQKRIVECVSELLAVCDEFE